MRQLAKTFPVLFVSIGYAQSSIDISANKIDYGFTTSTFAGASANNFTLKNFSKESVNFNALTGQNISISNYGWKQGLFFWVNLSSRFAYKPEVNAVFCVNNYKNVLAENTEQFYSTSVGIEFKPQLIIRLGCCDTKPILKMAKNMSYYLTGKQAYLIVGPKFNYLNSDKRCQRNTDATYTSIGAVFGGGIDNLFQNMNFAPELLVSIEYRTGKNNMNPISINRYYASLSLAVNFF